MVLLQLQLVRLVCCRHVESQSWESQVTHRDKPPDFSTLKSMLFSEKQTKKERKNAISPNVKVRKTIPGSAPTDIVIYSRPEPILHPSGVKICSVVLCNSADKPGNKLHKTSLVEFIQNKFCLLHKKKKRFITCFSNWQEEWVKKVPSIYITV